PLRAGSTRPSARSSSSSSSATSSSSTWSRAASGCSPRSPPSTTRCSAAARVTGSGSRGRRRMPSSSTSEPPRGDETTRLAIEEVEAILEQRPPKAEGAQGEGVRGGRSGGWLTTGLAAPGFLYLGFYLLAPLVVIVLVSFWTRSDAAGGFDRVWTTANYANLFHDSTYWNNMLTTFETSLIAVGACLVLGFPVAYFLALKVQSLRMQIVLFIVAL